MDSQPLHKYQINGLNFTSNIKVAESRQRIERIKNNNPLIYPLISLNNLSVASGVDYSIIHKIVRRHPSYKRYLPIKRKNTKNLRRLENFIHLLQIYIKFRHGY